MIFGIQRAIGVICFASILAGCIPYRFVDVPGFRGTVVSAKDGQPIAGARVSLSMGRGGGTEKAFGSAPASGDGAFVLKPKRYWGIYVVPMDFIGYFGTVEIAAPGFRTVRIPFKSAPDAPASTDMGTVSLEPAG
jgi:hypothetical protein